MSISKATVAQAIAALSSVDGVLMEPSALAEDAMVLTLAFDKEDDYKAAVVNTVKALKDISKGRVAPSALSGTYEGWSSFHYQPRVAQGTAATMRMIFRQANGSLYVLGFGHRHVPSNIYRRLAELRLQSSGGTSTSQE